MDPESEVSLGARDFPEGYPAGGMGTPMCWAASVPAPVGHLGSQVPPSRCKADPGRPLPLGLGPAVTSPL